jgi:hypothetical protein
MRSRLLVLGFVPLVLAIGLAGLASGQFPPPDKKGPPGGFGFGPPMGQTRQILEKFDKDNNGRLDREERKAAMQSLANEPGFGRGGLGKGKGGPGGPGGMGKGGFGKGGFGKAFGGGDPPKPGPALRPEDVKEIVKGDLYAPLAYRTLFLEFEDADWQEQLAAFYRTDVDVPATLIVDGKKYPGVGVHYRGNSSYFTVGPGLKKSLNISLDHTDKTQRLYGHKTLNLLNGHDDDSQIRAVLFSRVAQEYIPAPRANVVRLSINGESWGVYASVEQFNKDFLQHFYQTDKGSRWKVPGRPGARGGLEYIGENINEYKRVYTIKSKDTDKAWKALVNLCKVLNQTPPDKLEKALEPILDIDAALKFLALDCALINMDGYWVRASDYNLYLDPKGKFHLLPHDINETFVPAGGPGMGGPGMGGPGMGGPGGFPGGRGATATGGGMKLDPLVGLNDPTKPLRSKLLAVPALKERYLRYVKAIAEKQLDWAYLGPIVASYRDLISKDVEAETRRLSSLEAFRKAIADKVESSEAGGFMRRSMPNLRAFADERRKFLLEHEAIRSLK